MYQRALAVFAILILVGSQSVQGASYTSVESIPSLMSNDTPVSRIIERNAQLDDPATYSLTNGESTEEQQGYIYNSYYAPSTVNFHDIYSNNLAMLADEPVLTTLRDIPSTEPTTTTTTEDSFHLNNLPTQFVEFHPQTVTIPPITSPPPMFLLNASLIKNFTEENTTPKTTTTTTEEPDDIEINVIPIKKEYQRGVLDLLFPASRVRTFKSVFDTFRRIMSHTFR